MPKVKIYDTTLRDGAQGEGISYSVMDKVSIAKELDMLGVHYIEGGWPGSNPKDMEFYLKMSKVRLKNSKLAAFSMTRRLNSKASDDPNIKSLVKSQAKIITIVGKTWDLHVSDVLKASLDENLEMIKDTVSFLKSCGLTVFYDAEHFFDAYKSNKEYALKTLLTAEEAGADAICLCDTNGGTLTAEVSRVISEIRGSIKVSLGIHCHNDAGVAIANSLAAVSAGCDIVQGTINGIGERSGNADLIVIIANLKLKMGIDCISDDKLKELTHVSHFVSEISNLKQRQDQPYVGESSFAHKGGMHVNAVQKLLSSYEHIDPALVGNTRHVLISDLAGRSNIVLKARELGFDLSNDARHLKTTLARIETLIRAQNDSAA